MSNSKTEHRPIVVSALSVGTLSDAIDDVLDSYENPRTWSIAGIYIETAEAGGYMGSASAFKPIPVAEFAEKLYERLFR